MLVNQKVLQNWVQKHRGTKMLVQIAKKGYEADFREKLVFEPLSYLRN